MTRSELVYLCDSNDLLDSGTGVPFEVLYLSQSCHAFAVRYQGTVYAYLNRCTHVPMELDYLPNQFFDHTGHWLICATHGALYRPDEAEVVLCYETLRILYERGQQHQQALGLGDDHPLRYLSANVRFMVLHEVGHALVDLLDLPVTGSQEDAVDQLAAILMLRFAGLDETPSQVIENLGMAANWMLSRSTGAYNLDAFASTHSLGEQRYFSLQCMIYGTDPAGFADMIATGELTAERAEGCEREMHLITRAWLRLLLPHLAPGYELYDEAARQYLERSS